MGSIDVREVENLILKLTRAVGKKGFGIAPVVEPEWWVLAVGRAFGEDGFETRERSRNELVARVEDAGIVLREYVWVWDDRGCAQLVVASFNSRPLAEKMAERLGRQGFDVRIRRAAPE